MSYTLYMVYKKKVNKTGPNLENWGSIQYWLKSALFFAKKGTKNFTTSYSISLLNVLHQTKAFYSFYKTWQGWIAECIKGLGKGL